MDGFLLFIVGFAIGILVISALLYVVLRREHRTEQIRRERLIEDYESQIRELGEQHRRNIKSARKTSVRGSRSAIKGKITEQMAALLPGFEYAASDARFIGNPIDYVIFDGLTEIRDGDLKKDELQVVLLEVKSGGGSLSTTQHTIAQAVEEGRVRFERVRVSDNGDIRIKAWPTKTRTSASKKTDSHLKDHEMSLAFLYEEKVVFQDERLKRIRRRYPRAYEKWCKDEEKVLAARFGAGASIEDLSVFLQRRPGAIRSRLRKLGLL